jgi:hypothetical protein
MSGWCITGRNSAAAAAPREIAQADGETARIVFGGYCTDILAFICVVGAVFVRIQCLGD